MMLMRDASIILKHGRVGGGPGFIRVRDSFGVASISCIIMKMLTVCPYLERLSPEDFLMLS